ncbi:DUF190 domain-containing protein [Ktedonospora formicarum]|uniref:DUF190 domain-containing protein n=1 Tax=Ktedonospora formicarum TaxID=2778364 RepID=A0A8J3I623_9CHLR|nr:DUF190 domain-containing protein [Ktedonospora formicarum]GHO46039.1 hypothetical protein KSX_42020 [Ktedonospora formicarum]
MANQLRASSRLRGKRLRIFIGEEQKQQGRPLYQLLLEAAYRHGALVATVLRGIEGFGPQQRLATNRFSDIAENLPLIVDIVIQEQRLSSLLVELDSLVEQGMITSTPIEMLLPGGDA